MSYGLSPQNEQFLEQQVSAGLYPSKEAALDAAVDMMRAVDDVITEVPAEHLTALEEAMADLEQNGEVEMTDADWDDLRQLARDVAEGRAPSAE